jgi:hydrogenase/urease accessory protein HupE
MKPIARLLLAWLCALGALTWCGAAAAHVITFSHIDLKLEPGRTEVVVQIPITALLQQVPPPLPAGTTDQALHATPLAPDVRAALAALATSRLQLKSGDRPPALVVDGVAPAGDDVAIAAHAPAVTGALAVQANLFPDDPLHKVFVNVYRGADLAGQYALDRHDPGFTLAAPERPLPEVIATFVGEGVHHIFIGPDHILFVLALVLLGGRLWSQVKIITAFTVAHSITLALATFDVVHPPSRLIESTIAFSIVVVGLHDLRQLRLEPGARRGPDPRTALAFLFGLVHGFGFASALAEMELPRQALAWSLAAFNIGVEIGQMTIVLLAAPIVMGLTRHAPPRVTRDVLSGAACVVVAAGGVWLVQRAFGP